MHQISFNLKHKANTPQPNVHVQNHLSPNPNHLLAQAEWGDKQNDAVNCHVLSRPTQ